MALAVVDNIPISTPIVEPICTTFAIAGTISYGLNLIDDVKELNEKKDKLNSIELKNPYGKDLSDKEKNAVKIKLQNEIEISKTNLKYKSVGVGLTAISTGAMIMAAFNPVTAPVTASFVLGTGIIGAITYSLGDEEFRNFANQKVYLLKRNGLLDLNLLNPFRAQNT